MQNAGTDQSFPSLYSGLLYSGSFWPVPLRYYARTWENFTMDFHVHTYVEVMYVFSGDCRVELRDGKENTEEHPLHTGQFILLDTGIAHRLVTDTKKPCAMLNVEFGFAPATGKLLILSQLKSNSCDFQKLLGRKQPVILGQDLRGDVFRALDQLVSTLSGSNDLQTGSIADTEMALFLLRLAQAVCSEESSPKTMQHVRQAVAYIQRNFDQPLTAALIAGHVQISQDYLHHVFRQEMGETLTSFITRTRIDHAMVLLEHSKADIADIACMTGFGSRQQFTRCFARRNGIPPGAYRNRRIRMASSPKSSYPQD